MLIIQEVKVKKNELNQSSEFKDIEQRLCLDVITYEGATQKPVRTAVRKLNENEELKVVSLCGMYNFYLKNKEDNKLWSSRLSVVNTEFNLDLVEVDVNGTLMFMRATLVKKMLPDRFEIRKTQDSKFVVVSKN